MLCPSTKRNHPSSHLIGSHAHEALACISDQTSHGLGLRFCAVNARLEQAFWIARSMPQSGTRVWLCPRRDADSARRLLEKASDMPRTRTQSRTKALCLHTRNRLDAATYTFKACEKMGTAVSQHQKRIMPNTTSSVVQAQWKYGLQYPVPDRGWVIQADIEHVCAKVLRHAISDRKVFLARHAT